MSKWRSGGGRSSQPHGRSTVALATHWRPGVEKYRGADLGESLAFERWWWLDTEMRKTLGAVDYSARRGGERVRERTKDKLKRIGGEQVRSSYISWTGSFFP